MNAVSKRLQMLITALAAFGLAAILAVVVWSARSLVKRSVPQRLLAAVFSSLSKESISIRAEPQSVSSGDRIDLVWNYVGQRKDLNWEFSYECREGLGLAAESGEKIKCDSRYPLGGRFSFVVIPSSEATEDLRLTLTIFANGGGESGNDLSASTAVTVRAAKAAGGSSVAAASPAQNQKVPESIARETAAPGATKVKVYTLGQSRSDSRSIRPDLSVKVVDTGIIRADNGEFMRATSTPRGVETGVVFDVENVGGTTSVKWRFSATLPVIYDNYFLSDIQDALAPGDKIRFTLGFRHLRYRGENAVTLTIDPGNELNDANRANDSATATVVSEY